MFGGFRRRAEPELPPRPDPAPEPAYRPDRVDQEVYVSRATEADTDLHPQRLDGRSLTGPLPVRSRTVPRAPRPEPPEPDQALRSALAEFLSRRAAMPAPAPSPPADHAKAETPSRARRGPLRASGSPHGPGTRRAPTEPPRRRRSSRRPTPDAGSPPTFLFDRLLTAAELEQAGLEVETRPSRVYPVRWPGSTGERQIRPEYHGAGVTPAGARMRTRGLALLFPPHTVHARTSPSTVTGDTCELIRTDHVHIRQAIVAPDDALRSGEAHRVLARARHGADNTRVVDDLRRTLGEQPATRRGQCAASLHEAEAVRLGDDTLTCLGSGYVVERTTVPAGALLAADGRLARRYVDLVAAPPEPGALAGFLTDLLGAAENTTPDNVLGYADGLPEQPGAVLGLFGMVPVDRATGVLIGAGSRPHPELDLPRGDPA